MKTLILVAACAALTACVVTPDTETVEPDVGTDDEVVVVADADPDETPVVVDDADDEETPEPQPDLTDENGRATRFALQQAGELDGAGSGSAGFINEDSFEQLTHFEGWVADLYADVAGHCTIGHGHLVKLGPCDASVPAVYDNGITEDAGEALLDIDLDEAKTAVDQLITVPLSDNQYGALVDFAYNVGYGNLSKSTLRKKLNLGEYQLVGTEMRKWVRAGNNPFVQGLYNRRHSGARLFYKNSTIQDEWLVVTPTYQQPTCSNCPVAPAPPPPPDVNNEYNGQYWIYQRGIETIDVTEGETETPEDD